MIGRMISNTRNLFITSEHVYIVMGIGLDKSNKMMNVTTQKGVYTEVISINRYYRVDHLELHHN